MAYNPRISKGLRFFRGTGFNLATTPWQIINGISDWAAPSPTVRSIDMTTIKDEATVYAPGIRESGGSSMTLYFDDLNPSHQKLLIDDSKSTVNIPYRIDFTETGTSVAFMGHPTSVPVAGSIGSANSAAINFYVSGDPEWTFGSGDDPDSPDYPDGDYPSDVAIAGDQSDLASARGLFDTLTIGSVDCNMLTKQGVYNIYLTGTLNGPGFLAKLIVLSSKDSTYVNQIAISSATVDSSAVRVKYRSRTEVNNKIVWSPWSEGLMSERVGNGIRVTDGIISVPEYYGATTSKSGTAGLVPPATSSQRDKVLTGDGEWKYPSDVAIAGDQSDLASDRGIFNTLTGRSVDCNTLTKQGVYVIYPTGTLNGPGYMAKMIVLNSKDSTYVSQIAITSATAYAENTRIKHRSRAKINDEIVWSSWSEVIMSERIGDGIRVTDGIISVPEYDGATTSKSGTAGLVPPATASQRGKSLLGNGYWGDPEYAVKSAIADKAVCTPNIVSGRAGTNLPSGGTWKVLCDSNGKLSSFNLSGGARVSVSSGVLQDFIAFRIA